MVEVQVVGQWPEVKELLNVEGAPEVFLEVSFFQGGSAVCINLTNSQALRCGKKVSRSNNIVTIPVV
jgi:hypothetical protein